MGMIRRNRSCGLVGKEGPHPVPGGMVYHAEKKKPGLRIGGDKGKNLVFGPRYW